MAPFISSALETLISTDSPGLHHKIQSLAIDPAQELHQQTLLLILRSTRVRKIQLPSEHLGQLSGSQRSLQARPQLHSLPEIENENGQVYDPGDDEDGAEVLEDLQEAQEAPNYGDDFSASADTEDEAGGSDSNTLEDYDWPVYDRVDEGPLPEHDLPSSSFDLADYLIDPELRGDPVELVSDPGFDVEEDFEDGDPYGLSSDSGVPQQQQALSFDDMDDDYAEDDPMDLLEEPIECARGRPDFQESIEMDNSPMLHGGNIEDRGPYRMHGDDAASQQLGLDSEVRDDEEFEDGEPYAVHDDTASRQHHGLYFEEMGDDYAEDIPLFPLEEFAELGHGHFDREALYESDEQGHELMRDTWSDSNSNDGSGASYADVSDDTHIFYGEEDAHMFSSGEPAEWAYGYPEQDALYETDQQGAELVSNTWSDMDEGNEAPYTDASDDRHALFYDEEEFPPSSPQHNEPMSNVWMPPDDGDCAADADASDDVHTFHDEEWNPSAMLDRDDHGRETSHDRLPTQLTAAC